MDEKKTETLRRQLFDDTDSSVYAVLDGTATPDVLVWLLLLDPLP